MGYIANLKRNYIEIMKQEGLQKAIAAVIENAIAALEDEVYNSLHYDENFELFNEICDFIGGYNVNLMCNVDEYFGRMYPSEVFETFGSDFDFTDDFYLDDMTTGCDLMDLMQENGNDCNDCATAIYNGDVFRETTSDMDEIVEEAHETIEMLQEESKKVERAKAIFDSLVTFENADILMNAVWQAMQEG